MQQGVWDKSQGKDSEEVWRSVKKVCFVIIVIDYIFDYIFIGYIFIIIFLWFHI